MTSREYAQTIWSYGHNDDIMTSRDHVRSDCLTFDLTRVKFQVPTPMGNHCSKNSPLRHDDVIMTSREYAQAICLTFDLPRIKFQVLIPTGNLVPRPNGKSLF